MESLYRYGGEEFVVASEQIAHVAGKSSHVLAGSAHLPGCRHLQNRAGDRLGGWERLFDRLQSIEYADGNTFEHQPGIMLGTLGLKLRFRRASELIRQRLAPSTDSAGQWSPASAQCPRV